MAYCIFPVKKNIWRREQSMQLKLFSRLKCKIANFLPQAASVQQIHVHLFPDKGSSVNLSETLTNWLRAQDDDSLRGKQRLMLKESTHQRLEFHIKICMVFVSSRIGVEKPGPWTTKDGYFNDQCSLIRSEYQEVR